MAYDPEQGFFNCPLCGTCILIPDTGRSLAARQGSLRDEVRAHALNRHGLGDLREAEAQLGLESGDLELKE